MYRIYLPLLALCLLAGCQTSKVQSANNQNAQSASKGYEYVANDSQEYGAIKGFIIDPDTKEPVPFAKIYLENTSIGVTSDFDGQFHLKQIPEGTYDLKFSSVGYQAGQIPVEVFKGKTLVIKDGISLELYEDVIEKPIIYMYPEKACSVNVSLEYKGELTHTYPKSDGNWEVRADPDGTLEDANGRKYYGLYWEGIPEKSIVPNCGNVVEKDSLISFLEASLDQLGLNFKEANEFIVYWLPRLEQSEYNLIYFAQQEYTDQARLNILPKPETEIRVMMGFVPLKSPITIPPQKLPSRPERKGFTVVEWGGVECSNFEI